MPPLHLSSAALLPAPKEPHMPQTSNQVSIPAIERQPCPKCSTPMDLTRIEPDGPGTDQRTFECAKCQHLETTVVRYR
jgi:hypothetical protein